MKLRNLEIADAPFMLEWMKSPGITQHLNADFSSKTIEDCCSFILFSRNDSNNIHFAITSDKDEYMGTVSLKNVDRANKRAEFAIVVRDIAIGKGYSWFGMQEILRYAFFNLKLKSVYWCVSLNNKRACRFYDKHNFNEMVDIDESFRKRYKDLNNLKWYVTTNKDKIFPFDKKEILGCKIIKINTISTIDSGQLSFFEEKRDVPFEIKRFYYISNVQEGRKRGFHAHKKLKQILFCPYGRINLILDDGKQRDEVILDDPSIGIVIAKPLWREMQWLQNNSVLCVAASEYYDPEDYIRNYDDYLSFLLSAAD